MISIDIVILQIQYSSAFNDFMKKAKEKYYHSKVWDLFATENISLISKKDDPICDVTSAEAHVSLL